MPATGSGANALADVFNKQAEQLGRLRVQGLETLHKAAEFLKNAKVKQRNFDHLQAIPNEKIAH